jgi:endonuclease-8
MPEGPEIRREADRIAEAIVGQRLERVEFRLDRLARYSKLLEGQRVIRLETRGKALLTHFDNDLTMYSHNQLYGRWMICQPGKPPLTNRVLRVGLHTQRKSALLFSASEIEMLPTFTIDEHPFLRKLGPDILNDDLSWRDIVARLQEPRFIGRSLGSLYLDQSFLAGIGNYLRSEILHDARMAPSLHPRELTRGELGVLARATLLISQRAYQQAGVTNAPGRVRTLKHHGYRKADYRFSVFDREDLPCYVCTSHIQRIEVSGRRLYFCPNCQRSSRVRDADICNLTPEMQ